jgi:hypothetical protein
MTVFWFLASSVVVVLEVRPAAGSVAVATTSVLAERSMARAIA